jgi:hypothetical protein
MLEGWSERLARGRLPKPRRFVTAPRQHALAVDWAPFVSGPITLTEGSQVGPFEYLA